MESKESTAKENTAKVYGRDLPVSTRHTIEICNSIRGKSLLASKAFLEDVIAKKRAVPFTRHKRDISHKSPKVGPGRYPQKSAGEVLKLLESLEVNAQNKGLDTASLYLKEVIPNKSANVWHYGRQRRTKMKFTHLFMLAEERAEKKEKKKKETKAEVKK